MYDGRKAPPSDDTSIEIHPRYEPPDQPKADNLHDAVHVSGWTGYALAVGNPEREEWIKSDVVEELVMMR